MESAPVMALLDLLDKVRIADSTRKSLPAEQRPSFAVFTGAPVVNGNSFAIIERETDKRAQAKHASREF